ncbi:DUF2809 domain-containing protein [Afipia sp. GAS231]|uniref:ribosomal maturation YjgA family protein n=1 Tax=Afipia sp. GAS231 TaxID=1882747 RepID=UPI001FCE2420|nr:DUF2809 domain-containing protein [Afipia sp. GAS231]
MPRIKYAVLTALLIGAGLLVRSPLLGLPHAVAKYSGSIVWGAMVYAAIACLQPSRGLLRKAIAASLLAISIEFSQLLHTPALDAFRSTTIGVLLIGRFFSWWDIVAYLIGIAAICLFDKVALRPSRV